jgi:hypothetical protein
MHACWLALGGRRPVGPEGQVALDSGKGSFPGRGIGEAMSSVRYYYYYNYILQLLTKP